MSHLTSQELLEYAGGDRPDSIELHVRMCEECRRRVESFRSLEKTLHSMPLEKTSSSFTERVMQQAGIKTSPTFTWVIVKNLAPLFALTIVIGIMAVILKMTGSLQSADALQVTDATKQISDTLGTGVQTFNGWISKYFSFAFAKSTYGLTAFVLLFFGLVALLDKHVLMPMMKRKMM